MRAHLIRSPQKLKLHYLQFQQMVGTTSGKHAKASCEDINEGCCVAI